MKLLVLPLLLLFSLSTQAHKFQYEVLTQRKDVVWGFDFLSDGRIIYTERNGAVGIFNPASKMTVSVTGAPQVWAQGQGGMLDIRVHPQKKNTVYFTYSLPVGKAATTALGKAELVGTELKNVQLLFKAHEANTNTIHFGSRIEFDGEGHVFFTVGDRNERKNVQKLEYSTGKILRLKEDGSIPSDNPFIKVKNAKPEIWALGIRSPQGLAFNPVTKELWEVEMGPRGGDEINIVQKGANYGWPVVTFGREYYGLKIGEGSEKTGMTSPIAHWVPSISPSALAFYTGDAFPDWKNNAFLANLSGQHLRRLVIKENKVIEQQELLKEQNSRFRNVRSGPDGYLYVSTDDGKIARLKPAK